MSNASDLAEQLERGEADLEKETKIGAGGKNRTKLEQHEHKKPHTADGETRKMVTNAQNSEEKRKDEELTKKK